MKFPALGTYLIMKEGKKKKRKIQMLSALLCVYIKSKDKTSDQFQLLKFWSFHPTLFT